jgi:hypothetical protein
MWLDTTKKKTHKMLGIKGRTTKCLMQTIIGLSDIKRSLKRLHTVPTDVFIDEIVTFGRNT